MHPDKNDQPTHRSPDWLAGWDAGRATAHPLVGQIDALRAERDELLVTLAGVQEQANIYETKSARRAQLLFEGAARAERMASTITRQRSEIDTLRAAADDAARARMERDCAAVCSNCSEPELFNRAELSRRDGQYYHVGTDYLVWCKATPIRMNAEPPHG